MTTRRILIGLAAMMSLAAITFAGFALAWLVMPAATERVDGDTTAVLLYVWRTGEYDVQVETNGSRPYYVSILGPDGRTQRFNRSPGAVHLDSGVQTVEVEGCSLSYRVLARPLW